MQLPSGEPKPDNGRYPFRTIYLWSWLCLYHSVNHHRYGHSGIFSGHYKWWFLDICCKLIYWMARKHYVSLCIYTIIYISLYAYNHISPHIKIILYIYIYIIYWHIYIIKRTCFTTCQIKHDRLCSTTLGDFPREWLGIHSKPLFLGAQREQRDHTNDHVL